MWLRLVVSSVNSVVVQSGYYCLVCCLILLLYVLVLVWRVSLFWDVVWCFAGLGYCWWFGVA